MIWTQPRIHKRMLTLRFRLDVYKLIHRRRPLTDRERQGVQAIMNEANFLIHIHRATKGADHVRH